EEPGARSGWRARGVAAPGSETMGPGAPEAHGHRSSHTNRSPSSSSAPRSDRAASPTPLRGHEQLPLLGRRSTGGGTPRPASDAERTDAEDTDAANGIDPQGTDAKGMIVFRSRSLKRSCSPMK